MLDLRRIRVDQVGSLCPPQHLQDVFARYQRGAATSHELSEAQDKAISSILDRQSAMGLPRVSGGCRRAPC